MSDDFDIGYVMGIIVGEGSFSGDLKHPRLSVKQKNNRKPLEACQKMFGGTIHGPYRHKGKDGTVRIYDVWQLCGPRLRESVEMFARFLPESDKRDRFFEWTKKWRLS